MNTDPSTIQAGLSDNDVVLHLPNATVVLKEPAMHVTHAHSHTSHCCHSRPPRPEQRSAQVDARDVALLQAIRDGEEQAFWTLWLKHSRRLFGVCFREMNRHREDAEDAMQEAMLHAYTTLPRFAAAIAAPAPWLVRLTANTCRDIQRRHARDSRTAELAATLGTPDTAASEPAAEECDPAPLIARLPDRLREVFVLRVLQHVGYGEIAGRLGLTCATARKRVQQARAALRAWRDEAATPAPAIDVLLQCDAGRSPSGAGPGGACGA